MSSRPCCIDITVTVVMKRSELPASIPGGLRIGPVLGQQIPTQAPHLSTRLSVVLVALLVRLAPPDVSLATMVACWLTEVLLASWVTTCMLQPVDTNPPLAHSDLTWS